MKLIMENWRKFLIEQSQMDMITGPYGESPGGYDTLNSFKDDPPVSQPEDSKEIIPSDIPQFRDLDKPDQWEEFAALLEKTASPSSVREGKGIRLHNILEQIGHIQILNLEPGAPIRK